MSDQKTELRVNYHGHCSHCRHAMGSAREYAEEAQKKGLVRYGFSDHMPYPDNRADLRMPYAELEEYLNEIWELKREFAPQLTILCGLEGEYMEDVREYYESLLAGGKCEYLLLGQHFYKGSDGKMVNVYQMDSTVRYEEYSRFVVDAMRTGYFRYLAHPDLFFINNFPWDDHCERACDILIDGAVKYGFALEYNANGLRRGRQPFVDGERCPYPHDRLWEKVKETRIPVYVGSDCHVPGQVYDDAVLAAYERLREIGIIPQTEL